MDEAGVADCRIRPLERGDLQPVKALCVQCFPIEYPDDWYEELVGGRLLTLAAINPQFPHELAGLIVAQLRRINETNSEDRDIVAVSTKSNSDCSVIYILSLAVVPRYRRRGIASRLLQHMLSGAIDLLPRPLAVYLHVLSTNQAAIDFYARHGFRYHSTLINYYRIDHFYHDGLTYVLYINGGRPPWSFYECCHTICAVLCYPLRSLLRLRHYFCAK